MIEIPDILIEVLRKRIVAVCIPLFLGALTGFPANQGMEGQWFKVGCFSFDGAIPMT
jgi:hypothetical protein